MLLNARIAAVHFGYLTLPEFVSQTRRTLGTIQGLPRYRGHLLNWYDSTTPHPLEPRFVSTVDSGNLAAALWTLKQTALAFARQPPPDDTLWEGIADLALLLSGDTDPAARALGERVLKTALAAGLSWQLAAWVPGNDHPYLAPVALVWSPTRNRN